MTILKLLASDIYPSDLLQETSTLFKENGASCHHVQNTKFRLEKHVVKK